MAEIHPQADFHLSMSDLKCFSDIRKKYKLEREEMERLQQDHITRLCQKQVDDRVRQAEHDRLETIRQELESQEERSKATYFKGLDLLKDSSY